MPYKFHAEDQEDWPIQMLGLTVGIAEIIAVMISARLWQKTYLAI